MSWILVEYYCPTHGRFESLEARPAPDRKGCPVCKVSWPRVMSAPKAGTVWASAERQGGREKPPAPTALDTSSLAEGQPLSEFRKQRREMWKRHDFKKRRERGVR